VAATTLENYNECAITSLLPRLFMKIFRTGSLSVVKKCQQIFNFLSIESI